MKKDLRLNSRMTLRTALIVILLSVAGMGKIDAQEFEVDGLWYSVNSDHTSVTLIGGYQEELNIPEMVREYDWGPEYAVTAIGSRAFYYYSYSMGDLVIPNSVVSIGDSAFYYCEGFNGSLALGNSVETIGVDAFFCCWNLTGDLVIPDHVISIGEGAFDQCGFDSSLTLGNAVTTIGDRAFSNCYFCTGDLVIPNSVVSIGRDSFCGFRGSLILGNSVVTVGDRAFASCSFTGTLTLPNSITTIGKMAFSGATEFTGSLVIPSSVIAIGSNAFSGRFEQIFVDAANPMYDSRDNCNAIVETNSNKLIVGCNNTTIPSSITAIGEYALFDCTLVGTTHIPNSVVSIEEGAFEYCSGLQLPIPNCVRSIGSWAFFGCGLTGNLTIPKTVATIGVGAFAGNNVERIEVEAENPVYDSRNDCNAIIEKNTNTLVCGCTNTIIPGNVTSVGDEAFFSVSFMGNLVIPNSVTTIGDHAFSYCYNMSGNLVIPNSVITIGNEAFEGCSGLSNPLVLGSSISEIGSYAFYDCDGIDTVFSLNPNPPALFWDVFGYDVVDQLVVRCGDKDAYEASDWVNCFNTLLEDCAQYAINVENTTIGGTVSTSVNSAMLGEEVSISYIVEPGFVLNSITVCKADEETRIIPCNDNRFIMPNFDVVVKPTFVFTSVNENDNLEISVYPNPAKDFVKIEVEGLRSINVFNALGQQVFESPIDGNEFQFDLSDQEVGIYFVRIETVNGVTTKRVILTK